MTKQDTHRSVEPLQAGRTLVPIVIAVLAASFLSIVVFQAVQRSPQDGSWSDPSAAPDHGKDATTTSHSLAGSPPDVPTATGNAAAPAAGADLDAAIRAQLGAFFARMPAAVIPLNAEGRIDVHRAREELQDYLDTLGPESVDTLVAVLEEETDFSNRRFLMRTLGRIGTDTAADGLLAHYHRMATANVDSEAKHTIKALGLVDSPHSFEQLVHLATESGDPQHRHKVLEELGGHHMTGEAVPLYKELMVEDSRTNVRSYAARALKRTGDLRAAPDIEIALAAETNRYVRQSMIGALGGIGDANSVRALEAVANTDKDHVSRMSAVNSLRMIGGGAARTVLESIAEKDSNERVRQDAQRALTALAGG